jgi:hypothetical protein
MLYLRLTPIPALADGNLFVTSEIENTVYRINAPG